MKKNNNNNTGSDVWHSTATQKEKMKKSNKGGINLTMSFACWSVISDLTANRP